MKKTKSQDPFDALLEQYGNIVVASAKYERATLALNNFIKRMLMKYGGSHVYTSRLTYEEQAHYRTLQRALFQAELDYARGESSDE